MSNWILPTIGEKGSYELSPPFNITKEELYECKALRKISEHSDSGTDVFKTFYEPFSISDITYKEDVLNDCVIVSLFSDGGRWLHVPERYLKTPPNKNGVGYRGLSINIDLPPMPVSFDLSFLKTNLKEVVMSSIGCGSIVTPVETSRVSLVSETEHKRLTAKRKIAIDSKTLNSKINYWRKAYEDLLLKFKVLEDYIKKK